MSNKKTVYILGAGCSKEDGAPLVNDFFDVAFNNKLREYLNSEAKIRFSAVQRFREEELPGSNIEELLSYIDLEKVLKTKKHRDPLDIIRSDLIYLIGKTIKERMGTNPSKIYSKFMYNHLLKCYPNPSIISFNWDIATDNLLFKRGYDLDTSGKNGMILSLDYGTDFISYNNEDKISKGARESSLKLLKLHGSMNWLFCNRCKTNNKYFVYGEKVMVEIAEGTKIKCPKCENNLKPIIVPPTFKKIEENAVLTILREIWAEARKVVEDAEHIIIAGYSFPEDDVHFKLFFRSALHANYNKHKRPIVIDIINYKKYLNDKTEFEAHYKKMLDISEVEIRPHFHYLKFSEFADKKYDEFA